MSFIPPRLLEDPVLAATHDYALDPLDAGTLARAGEAACEPGDEPAALRRRAAGLLAVAGAALAETLSDPEDFYLTIAAAGSNRLADVMARHEDALPDPEEAVTLNDAQIASVQRLIAETWRVVTVAERSLADLTTPGLTGAALWAERRAAAHVLTSRAMASETLMELRGAGRFPDTAGTYGEETVARAHEMLVACGLPMEV
ncbi:hypothetical protein [Hyphobacterium marinum]|uniref:Uncharacterized protein n=1 Tax=Hyphobacterium marinum TaxID=3116574 RepID=A0ABU7M1F8_9PROT|nr:hypothetical protein [Hyphobacterium sp. Y6023]MEE2567653.1 hypothetical protein [Hyphobacterium sp. Y6023]